MKRYFEILKNIPLNEIKTKRINAWDDAKSLSYLLDEFPRTMHYQKHSCVTAAIEHLSKNSEVLEALPKQLIHCN
ncbi:MAG: hypothetical protein ACYDG2_25360 [Ruminiclostridium sp.]